MTISAGSKISRTRRKGAPAPRVDDPADIFDVTKARVLHRGLLPRHKHGIRVSLATIRKAANKTQVEIAEATGLDQSTIARLEGREDPKVSSLAKYAEALGGKLELVVVVNGRQYIVAPGAG